jgi:hypothetical protein
MIDFALYNLLASLKGFVLEVLQSLQSFALEYGKMFAYVGMVGILLAFGVPAFLAIMASSKAKQEERIRVLAKARVEYEKSQAKEQGPGKVMSI